MFPYNPVLLTVIAKELKRLSQSQKQRDYYVPTESGLVMTVINKVHFVN